MSKYDYLTDDSGDLPSPDSPERTLRDMYVVGGSANTDMTRFATCDPRKFMTAEECQKFDSLPDEFVVYRKR
jgi:hypothetical protein